MFPVSDPACEHDGFEVGTRADVPGSLTVFSLGIINHNTTNNNNTTNNYGYL